MGLVPFRRGRRPSGWWAPHPLGLHRRSAPAHWSGGRSCRRGIIRNRLRQLISFSPPYLFICNTSEYQIYSMHLSLSVQDYPLHFSTHLPPTQGDPDLIVRGKGCCVDQQTQAESDKHVWPLFAADIVLLRKFLIECDYDGRVRFLYELGGLHLLLYFKALQGYGHLLAGVVSILDNLSFLIPLQPIIKVLLGVLSHSITLEQCSIQIQKTRVLPQALADTCHHTIDLRQVPVPIHAYHIVIATNKGVQFNGADHALRQICFGLLFKGFIHVA